MRIARRKRGVCATVRSGWWSMGRKCRAAKSANRKRKAGAAPAGGRTPPATGSRILPRPTLSQVAVPTGQNCAIRGVPSCRTSSAPHAPSAVLVFVILREEYSSEASTWLVPVSYVSRTCLVQGGASPNQHYGHFRAFSTPPTPPAISIYYTFPTPRRAILSHFGREPWAFGISGCAGQDEERSTPHRRPGVRLSGRESQNRLAEMKTAPPSEA